MMKTLPSSMVLAAALLLSVAACGDEDDDPKPSGGSDAGTGTDASAGDVLAQVKEKLKTCDIIQSGSPVQLFPIGSNSDKCAASCFANASCSLLKTAACTGSPGGSLASCLDGCGFECRDGSGGTGANAPIECDGYEDCDDKSDEANCASYYFACSNGEDTNLTYKCDGENDCSDGSDEKSCATPFKCANGEEVPLTWQCDLQEDCSDGSDEADCGLLCGG